jgi:hypothetical protein
VGIRCADHATPLYRQKLALTLPTSGGSSGGIVRVRTKDHEVHFCFVFMLKSFLLATLPLLFTSDRVYSNGRPMKPNAGPLRRGQCRYSGGERYTHIHRTRGYTQHNPDETPRSVEDINRKSLLRASLGLNKLRREDHRDLVTRTGTNRNILHVGVHVFLMAASYPTSVSGNLSSQYLLPSRLNVSPVFVSITCGIFHCRPRDTRYREHSCFPDSSVSKCTADQYPTRPKV